MRKAIKFFKKDGDLLRSFYMPKRDDDNSNYDSELGLAQTFQPDPKDPNRQAFSTLTLKDPSSKELFKQLLNFLRVIKHVAAKDEFALQLSDAAPYIVGVDDEYEEHEHVDAPAERLFRRIKPLLEIALPEELTQPLDDDFFYNFIPSYMNSRSKTFKYHKDGPNYYEGKKFVKSAYKRMRENGYTPLEIHQAMDTYKKWLTEQGAFMYGSDAEGEHWNKASRLGIRDMLNNSKIFDIKLDDLITELEADPDMESDMRLKRLVPMLKGVV